MVAGLALVLSLAAPTSREEGPGAASLPAQSNTRPVTPERNATDPTVPLQLKIDELKEHRPSLLPPVILLGTGVVLLTVGVVEFQQQCAPDTICLPIEGAGLGILGSALGLGGLIWLIVEANLRADFNGQIELLEAEKAMFADVARRPSLAPWTRGSASGLALSVPLP